MQHLRSVNTLEDMSLMAKEIMSNLQQYPIVLLKGELGAGKTTLVQMICKNMGVDEQVTSPTYTLINEYTTNNHKKIYHFDFYRIEKEDELGQIGFYEYIDSNNICLIEWPQIAEKYIEDMPYMEINIHKKHEGREIEIVYNQLSV